MKRTGLFLSLLCAVLLFGCKEEEPGTLELLHVFVGTTEINLTEPMTEGLPLDRSITLAFSAALDNTITEDALMLKANGQPASTSISFSGKSLIVFPTSPLNSNSVYTLSLSAGIKGAKGESFTPMEVTFKTTAEDLEVISLEIGGLPISGTSRILDVPLDLTIAIHFNIPVNEATVNDAMSITGPNAPALNFTLSDNDQTATFTGAAPLKYLSRYTFTLSNELKGSQGESFSEYKKTFYTAVDDTPKFPLLPNDEDNDNDNTNDLLSVVQKQTFKYFYDFAHPASGMARERNTSGNTITSGGSGFGIMALIVGMERNFITRQQGLDRMDKILDFLETADEFHGAWAHWMDGNTGNVIPFSANDNGGDLVETSFLVQGLITFRQYLNAGIPEESALIDRINFLWERVDWDWYRKGGQNVLYWHWSPDKGWIMNFPLSGYFEQQITYFLAAASPTHSIPKVVYTNGFTQNGGFVRNDTYTYNGNTYPLKVGGLFPLFWVQYSYLGLNPHFSDDYVDYWQQGVNASLINHDYCVQNPKQFAGYSDECWGLTASDNQSGYNAHSPSNDLGVITPTAALSSFPYTPDESMKALKFFYYKMGDRLWGDYGFYDAFNATENWYASSYLAIDQGPIIVMIENYRTGLLWNLFMSAPEVQNAMTELNFQD
jgi:hypothetical protein